MSSSGSRPDMAEPERVFHVFSRLPTELRLKIWNLTHMQPRIVPVLCGTRSMSTPSPERLAPSSSGCVSPARILTTLHTCRESRHEALRQYHLSFGMYRGPGRIYFNMDADILYFGHRDGFMASESQFRTVMSLCDPEDLARVKKVAINDALFWIGPEYQSMSASSKTVEALGAIRTRMPGVEELIFVPKDENPVYDRGAMFLEPNANIKHAALLEMQVQEAMRAICEEHPEWNPPGWRVMMLGTPGSRVSGQWGHPVYERA